MQIQPTTPERAGLVQSSNTPPPAFELAAEKPYKVPKFTYERGGTAAARLYHQSPRP